MLVLSGVSSLGILTSAMSPAEMTNVTASIQKAHATENWAVISPAMAKPMAVDPNCAIAISELAAPSSSSLAISGRTLSFAGSKNCWTDAESSTST